MKSLVDFINERGPAPMDRMTQDITDIFSDADFAKCNKVRIEDVIENIKADVESLDEPEFNMRAVTSALKPLSKYPVYELSQDMLDELTNGGRHDFMNFDDDAIAESEHLSLCISGSRTTLIGLRIYTDSDYDYQAWIVK